MTKKSSVLESENAVEFIMCRSSVAYFVFNYVQIYNATISDWIPFKLWPRQEDVLKSFDNDRKILVLKARQLGITWLALSYALWVLVFQAPASILLFSLKREEAEELLLRLKQMYSRLPRWLQAETIERDSNRYFELSTGSRALAFSTKGGRSYTATLVIVDEADFVPELNQFMNAVKPTIDAGGKLLMISTSDKSRPVSTFKNLFRAAGTGVGEYKSVFLPWFAAPARNKQWYESTRAEMFQQRGSDDDFFQEYPATAEEALAAEQMDRRIPWDWVAKCLDNDVHVFEGEDLPSGAPSIQQLTIYELPVVGRNYVIGVDTAEGNPSSDPSCATVLDAATWNEVAVIYGSIEPKVLAGYVSSVGEWYNTADCMAERNNHGHAFILAMQEIGALRMLPGHDARVGWHSNIKGKPLMYDCLADAVRDRETVIRSGDTAVEIASIQASNLQAPSKLHDDRADSYALAIVPLRLGSYTSDIGGYLPAKDVLEDYDSEAW